jgi:hypothetical protein
MRKPLTTLALSAALLGLPSLPAAAQVGGDEAPGTFAEPSIVNPSWSFDVEMGRPNAIAVRDDRGMTRWYWYVAYKVTNNTGEDRLFIPDITVTDDLGRIVPTNRRIPPSVYPAIAQRLGNPLLESPNDVVGRLLQGPDFAKESVAIWPAASEDVDQFTVFFGGADGETKPLKSPATGQTITEPAVDPITGEPILGEDGQPVQRPVMVRRTRAYTYHTPGTLSGSDDFQQQPVRLVDEFAVMR